MNKGRVSNLLRKLGLMHFIDNTRYLYHRIRNNRQNKEFVKKHPDVKLPPDYLMYESFQLNYKRYYIDSYETAKWLKDFFIKYKQPDNLEILDWGCGPGRIIRHMPSLFPITCRFYGTDYNPSSVKWCSENLPGIEFNLNTIQPELPYSDNKFDIIYGISIFTHLSEEMHWGWAKELLRIMKPQGILFLTTQGRNFFGKMTAEEIDQFKKGELVVRGQVTEGHRTYSAFQPETFMKRLFEGHEVLEFIEQEKEPGQFPPQDIWIIRKK